MTLLNSNQDDLNIITDLVDNINLEEFDYELNKEKIAQFPLKNRHESKLIKVENVRKNISHHRFYDLPNLLNDNSLLINNNSKVIQARILLTKPSGGRIEFLLLDCIYPSNDPQIALKETSLLKWKVIIGGKKINVGLVIDTIYENKKISFTVLEKNQNEGVIEISIKNIDDTINTITFGDILEKMGKIPLPPYMNREVTDDDKISYQTVYAKYEGSVAAPTAGLHFNEDIIQKLKNEKNIKVESVTLHVGAGTFNPIKDDSIGSHLMHTEKINVSKELISKLIDNINQKNDIIAVGTTSIRTLETLYWVGAKLILGYKINLHNYDFKLLGQWEPYLIDEKLKVIDKQIFVIEALQKIIDELENNNLDNINGATQLLIIPSYKFKIVNVLITNFHTPKSTLILLVSAFIGKDLWKSYYNEALNNDYRFLSYGDSSILFLDK